MIRHPHIFHSSKRTGPPLRNFSASLTLPMRSLSKIEYRNHVSGAAACAGIPDGMLARLQPKC